MKTKEEILEKHLVFMSAPPLNGTQKHFVLNAMQECSDQQYEIDWKNLLQKYLNECTNNIGNAIVFDTAPHNLFEWFKANVKQSYELSRNTIINRFDSEVFTPPFRLGRKQKRAILDSNGKEVIVMPSNSEKQAQLYCNYLNNDQQSEVKMPTDKEIEKFLLMVMFSEKTAISITAFDIVKSALKHFMK